jgi:two-component system sensor histidine kinase YesM
MKKTRNRSLQKSILLIIALFTLVIGAVISATSLGFYNYYTKKSLLQNTYNNMLFLADSINSNLSAVKHLSAFCQAHPDLGNYMNYTAESSSQIAIRAYDRLYEEYRLSPAKSFVHRIIVGNEFGKYLMICQADYSTPGNVNTITKALPQYEQQISGESYDFTAGYIIDPYVNRYDTRVLILIRPITYNFSSRQGGFVSISVRENLFTDAFRLYSLPKDSTLYLSLGEHLYRMSPDRLIEVDNAISFRRLNNYTLSDLAYVSEYYDSAGNKKGYAVTRKLSENGCMITQTISEKELRSQAFFFYGIFLLCLLLAVVLCFILYLILNRIIHRPVLQIQNRLQKISEGDFNRDLSIEWNHELGDIGRGINDLSSHIEALIAVRIQNEKDKKDLEYKMLQSQINPHFLYNTLNSIKWMAVTQGAEGIAEMTTALAKLLRSISKGTSTEIPLKDELDLVQDYFTIQQYRYGSTLSLVIDTADEDLFTCKILKFTLQPLVENAIFHGIEPKHTTGTICIRISAEPENAPAVLRISVEDDGIGMTEEQLAHLFDAEEPDPGHMFKEIGIRNIHKRIQYEYGEEYGITAESEPDSYTRMTIRIPIRRSDYV